MTIQTILLGMGYTFARAATLGFDIISLMMLRLSGSSLLMFLLWKISGETPIEMSKLKSKLPSLLFLACIGILMNQFCFMLGLKLTTPASSSLLYALTPMIAFCFSAWYFHSEQFTRKKLLSILLALAGVVIVILARFQEQGNGALGGNFITLVAVLMWSLYISFSRPLLQIFPPIQLTLIIMLIGTVCFMPFGISSILEFPFSTVSNEEWFGLGYIIAVNSVIGYWLLMFSLTKAPSSEVSIFINAQPLVAAVFSYFYNGETISALVAVGGGLILAGIWFMNQKH